MKRSGVKRYIRLLLVMVMMISVSGISYPQETPNRRKIERQKKKNEKKAAKEYEKAVKQHNKNQSKDTKQMMKKSRKDSPKRTPVKPASGKKCK